MIRVAGAFTLALVCSCASGSRRGLTSDVDCDYVVRNATDIALEVRRFEERRLGGVGTLNPGEQISDRAPCAEGRVYVLGIPVPRQVGAPTGRPAFGFADLVRGERAQITLYLP